MVLNDGPVSAEVSILNFVVSSCGHRTCICSQSMRFVPKFGTEVHTYAEFWLLITNSVPNSIKEP
jgi:hypothetical protein